MRKVYIETNGCSVLRHDTQRYSKYFRLNGWKEVGSPHDADLVLFTTCAVIQKTEDFSIESLKRIKNEMKKDARLIVGGCLPKINPERLKNVFNGTSFSKDEEYILDDIVGDKVKIEDVFWDDDIFREHSFGEPGLCYSKEQLGELKLARMLSKKFNNPHFIEIYDYLTKGRFFWKEEKPVFEVKVADGCNYKCSYCATKNAKGNLKSRDPNRILEEFKIGVKKGYSKIVLTGDEVGDYGLDIGTTLIELLNALIPESKKSKIALRYVSPNALIRQYNQLKPYFQSGEIYYFCASFQSGSPKILRLMNRPENIDDFTSLIAKMNKECPKVYKHTQVMVGFPQETEQDFKQSLNAIEKANFEYVTIVQYSDRPHTKSILMNGHIKDEVIDKRSKMAISLVSNLRKEKLKTLIFEELLKEC